MGKSKNTVMFLCHKFLYYKNNSQKPKNEISSINNPFLYFITLLTDVESWYYTQALKCLLEADSVFKVGG